MHFDGICSTCKKNDRNNGKNLVEVGWHDDVVVSTVDSKKVLGSNPSLDCMGFLWALMFPLTVQRHTHEADWRL